MPEAHLRILMLIPQLGFGGAEGSFLRLAFHLATRAEVTIAVMDDPYGKPSHLLNATGFEISVIRLDDSNKQSGKLLRWLRMLRRLRTLKCRHEVTISFLSGTNFLNALAGPSGRTIVSERGSKRYDIGMSACQRLLWTQVLDRLTYLRADRIVAASEGLATEIVTANRWTARRLVAIEGTVEPETLVNAADLPIELELVPLANCDTVVAFGRLHIQKGYDVLLAAFARVRAGRPNARLLLIGEGPEEGRLRAQAAELGLTVATNGATADIIMPGMLQNPLRLLRLGRVFVLPSRYEGLPNALIEALAAGIPVLAADCPWGPRSILSEGSLPEGVAAPPLPFTLPHGVLMPLPDLPGAVDCWSSEIGRALSAPAPLRLGSAERIAAISRYGIAHTGPIWFELAKDLARGEAPQ